jgi:hypothetical protein
MHMNVPFLFFLKWKFKKKKSYAKKNYNFWLVAIIIYKFKLQFSFLPLRTVCETKLSR